MLIWYLSIVKKLIIPLLIFFAVFAFTSPIHARVTPEDIVNERKAEYNSRVKNYSAGNKQKLEEFNKKIHQLNWKICAELEENMTRQGLILDEFQQRNGGVETEAMKESRYWITYAHEAVAYQAAKVYVFNLTGEANVNKDILLTINQLNAEIVTLKGKVLKSQNILKNTVSGEGSKAPAKQEQGGEG